MWYINIWSKKNAWKSLPKIPKQNGSTDAIGVLIQNALIKPESVGIPKVEQVSPTSGNKNIALSHQPKSEHNETMN